MNLDRQIQSLIDGAPDPDSRASVLAIAPILQQVAATLPQTEYYICQSPQGEWAITSLQHRQQSQLATKVVYAFTQVRDIYVFAQGQSANYVSVKMPVIQLLFDLLAFPEIDRIVFLNDSANLDRGQDISRQKLEDSIVEYLERHPIPAEPTSILPPDIC